MQRLKLEAILKVHDGCVSIKNLPTHFHVLPDVPLPRLFFPFICRLQQLCVRPLLLSNNDMNQVVTCFSLTCCDTVIAKPDVFYKVLKSIYASYRC